MKIHEYQAKALFRAYGLPVLKGEVAANSTEAVAKATAVSAQGPWVLKAQVHAGGRGKGGGIQVSRTLDDVRKNAEKILSRPLITPQTGREGTTVRKLLIEEGCEIDRELYCAAVLDRARASVALMASSEGGVEIESRFQSQPHL